MHRVGSLYNTVQDSRSTKHQNQERYFVFLHFIDFPVLPRLRTSQVKDLSILVCLRVSVSSISPVSNASVTL
jgi:hypothetical protein